MSGALEQTGSDRTFVNTFKGKFTIRTSAETEGVLSRVNKNGKTVHELHYDQLSDVFIQKFEKRHDPDFGYSWNIYLAHEKSEALYKLTMPFSGRITMGIFLRLPNLDINKSMHLKMYYFEEEDKAALVIFQDGKKILPFWTKDEPKDLPQLVQDTVNGKVVWKSDARMAFVEKFLAEKVEPVMNQLDTAPEEAEKETEAEADQTAVETAEPTWDADAKTLKMKNDDGKWYECDEKGAWKRDQAGQMIEALPF